ncbi:MAG: asparaginase [Candidatus Marinimicrobia bacterium]|nr:asparaginase [Candidatus Neomarinimicrobiota bacterium]|tara:strand:- start:6241 stop:6729 length:489 start_codon:yes stop_codon:yes gene_type:complete
MVIKILVTGGTFDKEYNEISGELYFNGTHIREILDLGRAQIDVEIIELMLIDSLDMQDKDREIIVQNCKDIKSDQIVITHGTDTMTKTAKYLAEANLKKTMVLTGAMIPYKFGSSDGLFNLGGALAFVQSLSHGVYIAMNGYCFEWDKVIKNKTTGVFEKKA